MSNRTYSQAINDGKATPAFLYVWDSNQTYIDGNGATLTGCNRLLTTSDLRNVNPSHFNNISISGSGFMGLPSSACHSITFLTSSVICDIQTSGDATYATSVSLPNLIIPVLANSNEITLRRTDRSTTGNTVSFEFN